jgi:selenide,water dikinase
LSNIILPRMRDRMQGEVLREITAGAASVFDAVGAVVIGGHTSVGPELSVGFTVTGTVAGDARGHSVDQARVGDRLILTKPIGSGTIMAAEMRAAAPGAVVVEALRRMGQEGGEAARILSPVAHAMTDVTGYGLIGHLRTIVAGSGVGARIDVPRVPLMAGARELAAGGARSSLFPQNLRLCDGIDGFDPDLPEHALLIDPQTAGGLLTTVPADKVAATLRALIDAGYDAADIGEMTGAGITLT